MDTLASSPTKCEDELIQKLARLLELKPLAAELDKLKKELKPLFEGEPQVRVGPYLVTGQTVSREGYFAKPCTYWDWKVTPLLPGVLDDVSTASDVMPKTTEEETHGQCQSPCANKVL